MKRLTYLALASVMLTSLFYACSPEELALDETQLSKEVIDNLNRLGLNPDGAYWSDGDQAYIVEGDIRITPDQLTSTPTTVRVPNEEQYHTFNLVSVSGTRTINIFVDRRASSVEAAVDAAIARYNAENLQLVFQKVTRKRDADITFGTAPRNAGYLASAGFPTSTGDPHNSIKVNTNFLSANNWGFNTVVSIMAHELGHCIGFRHTDWFDRSISCGGAPTNEGQQNTGVGAVHIPNTPTTNVSTNNGSFMLSCIGNGINRPFNADDSEALDYLY